MSNDGLHWQLFLSTNTRRVAAEQCHWKRTHFCGRSMTGDIFHKSENRYEQGHCAVPLRKAFYHWWHAIFIYLRIINAGIHNSFPYYKFHSSLCWQFYFYFTNTMKTLFCNYLILRLICMNNIWIEALTLMIHCSS